MHGRILYEIFLRLFTLDEYILNTGGGNTMFKITLAIAPDHDIKTDFCIYLYVLKYEDLKHGPISLNMSLRTT